MEELQHTKGFGKGHMNLYVGTSGYSYPKVEGGEILPRRIVGEGDAAFTTGKHFGSCRKQQHISAGMPKGLKVS